MDFSVSFIFIHNGENLDFRNVLCISLLKGTFVVNCFWLICSEAREHYFFSQFSFWFFSFFASKASKLYVVNFVTEVKHLRDSYWPSKIPWCFCTLRHFERRNWVKKAILAHIRREENADLFHISSFCSKIMFWGALCAISAFCLFTGDLFFLKPQTASVIHKHGLYVKRGHI